MCNVPIHIQIKKSIFSSYSLFMGLSPEAFTIFLGTNYTDDMCSLFVCICDEQHIILYISTRNKILSPPNYLLHNNYYYTVRARRRRLPGTFFVSSSGGSRPCKEKRRVGGVDAVAEAAATL